MATKPTIDVPPKQIFVSKNSFSTVGFVVFSFRRDIQMSDSRFRSPGIDQHLPSVSGVYISIHSCLQGFKSIFLINRLPHTAALKKSPFLSLSLFVSS